MKFFQKNELKLLWPFYLDALLSPLLYFLPAFIVVFLTGLELSFFQIGLLIAVTPLFMLIFEIPTGAVADLYGRKFSVLLGISLEGLVVLSLFFVRDYYLLLAAFAALGFASTLSSGSKEAWVIDLVKGKGKNLSRSYFHKSQGIDAFALVISGILGAFLVKWFGMSSIWLFAFFSFMISVSILLFAKENFAKRKVKIGRSFRGLFRQSKETVSYGYKHPVLYYYLMATFVFVVALSFGISMTWTPFLLDLDFPAHYFGYMWSAIAVIMMTSPIISSKFLKEKKEKKFIMIGFFLSALTMFFILLPKRWIPALIILLAVQFFMMLGMPASKMYFHRFVPSKLRATMKSVDSMIASLAGIVAMPLVGYLVDVIGARYTIFIYAPLMFLVIFIYSRIKEEEISE
ncbi:MFS transporter [archaeon]|jgi:MFS family permease|nr:MFS transporter [archaeon]MBT3577374.1 MFS transporter [archaeon]MBT6820383.1 MFS transporter [archaeon]MBT6956142.1 MFS transporter [archaeon]MBT7025197.1 MFS transporter [archaeon]